MASDAQLTWAKGIVGLLLLGLAVGTAIFAILIVVDMFKLRKELGGELSGRELPFIDQKDSPDDQVKRKVDGNIGVASTAVVASVMMGGFSLWVFCKGLSKCSTKIGMWFFMIFWIILISVKFYFNMDHWTTPKSDGKGFVAKSILFVFFMFMDLTTCCVGYFLGCCCCQAEE